MDVHIYIQEETLTDGSKVYNVSLGNLKLNACSERDAVTLADILMSTIDQHTVNRSVVHYG